MAENKLADLSMDFAVKILDRFGKRQIWIGYSLGSVIIMPLTHFYLF